MKKIHSWFIVSVFISLVCVFAFVIQMNADMIQIDEGIVRVAEMHLLAFSGSSDASDYGELTLSAPVDCHTVQRISSQLKAYTGKSLTPLRGRTEMKLFFIYSDGIPVEIMTLRNDDNAGWIQDSIGRYDIKEVIDSVNQLYAVTSLNEPIAFVMENRHIYPYTPNRYNGYMAEYKSRNGEERIEIYRTRDVLLDYYEKKKDWPISIEDVLKIHRGEIKPPDNYYDAVNIIPSRHYPVWPFWLMVIGIPVAVIALSVGTVILVRKRKHAK